MPIYEESIAINKIIIKPITIICIAQPNKSFAPSNPVLPTVSGCPQWGHILATVETFSLHAGHGFVGN